MCDFWSSYSPSNYPKLLTYHVSFSSTRSGSTDGSGRCTPPNTSVGFIRLCVPFCGEFIWERIKDALEALPELDSDGYEEDSFTTDRPLAFNYFQAVILHRISLRLCRPPDPNTAYRRQSMWVQIQMSQLLLDIHI